VAERRVRILIVEDEMLVAMNIEDMLLDLGHEVAGIASRLEPALSLAREASFDLALLDVNLAGASSFPVAAIIRERNLPLIFATGYGPKGVAEEFQSYPVLQKPFRSHELDRTIASALRSRDTAA
jgi:CheY-like chemotaxis protein